MGLFDMLGAGSNFQAGGSNIKAGAAKSDIDWTNEEARRGILQQQQFLSALGGQNWMGKQADVFGQQQGLLGQYGNVYGQQQGILGQQQALAGQLGQQAAGGGPNPAMAQLALTTGQNMQGQAALMASQRGGSRNPAMLSRQAAQQGAGIQQQAAGQAAVMSAQQQLAAQQALMQQQQAMGGMTNNMGNITGAMGQQQMNMSNVAGQNVGLQANAQNALGQLTNQRYGAQLGDYRQTQGQRVALLQNMNNVNAATQMQNAQNAAGILGGVLNAGGSAAGMNQGGVAGGRSPLCDYAKMSSGGRVGGAPPKAMGDSPQNDTVPAMLSPGEIVIPRTKAHDERKIAAFLNGLLGTNLMPGAQEK